ncbi:D-alanyl-D-alanine dipeptidase, partial [Patescibacteria group bacterium]|nr:D-alanyl-D-alanine dipeptidase [Patescibacteria group bacterium]
RNNRVLLRNAMVKAGFRQDKDEWWHYDYGNQIWALELNKSFAFYGEASPVE